MEALLIKWLPLLISLGSFAVSILAFFNGRKSRLESKDAALFKLKLEALLAAKTCEAEWQCVVSDLYHAQERVKGLKPPHPGGGAILDYYSNLDRFLKSALSNAHSLARDIEAKFDAYSENDAKIVLRTCEAQNLQMARDREEMNRKLRLLETPPPPAGYFSS